MSIAAMADLGYSVDLTKADSYSFAGLRSAAAVAAPDAAASTPQPSTEPVTLVRPSGRLRDGHTVPLGK